MEIPLLALSLSLLISGCRAPELGEEPWQGFEQGATRGFATLGLFADYGTEIASDFVDEPDDPPVLDLDLEGKFGAAAGAEHFLTDDFVLRAGVDLRFFQPGNVRAKDPAATGDLDQFFDFEDVEYYELFLALRWLAPPFRNIARGRLRAYLQGKLGWVPSIGADSRLIFGLEGIPDPEFEFDGSAYWNAGAGGGLMYQWTEHTTVYVGFLYEWPLENTRDAVDLELEVVPGTFFTIPIELELNPEGIIGFWGVSFGF